MLHELEKTRYAAVEPLFTKLRNNAAIESIFNSKNEVRLFVDDPKRPTSAFVLNSWAYYYLAGNSDNGRFNAALADFLENEYFPECVKNGYNTDFAFYPDTDEWCDRVEKMFSSLNLTKSGKTYFDYDINRFEKNWRDQIPKGFAVKKISPELIASIENSHEFVDYINCFWVTADKYFEKGMGYCALNEVDFAAICISVFASENDRELGIKTFPEFRRKGLAYVTACAYIEDCLRNGFNPVWSCFSENEVSVELAKKLGYTIRDAHPIYFASLGG